MPYSRGCVFWKLHIFMEAGEGRAGSMEPLEALGLLPRRPDQGLPWACHQGLPWACHLGWSWALRLERRQILGLGWT